VNPWLGLLVISLLAASCSDDPQADGLAADISELPGPGAELGNGLVVPEDALLLPPVHAAAPYVGPDIEHETWAADLVLDGDPRVVVNDLVAQLRDRGTAVRFGCSTSARGIDCFVNGRRSEDGRVQEEVRLQLERSAADEGRYRSGGRLLVTRWPGPGIGHPNPVPGGQDDPELELDPLPPAPTPPEVPDVGEAFPEVELLPTGLVVAEGSAVVTPIREFGCEDGGFVAPLVVTGDPDAVMDDYEAQFDRRDWALLQRTEDEFRGQRVIDLSAYYGDASLELSITVSEGDGPSWGRLRNDVPCSD
jgi:hypothetical protein